MARFAPQERVDELQDLSGKVFVVTGGANGIGRALVTQLHAQGACIVFGDLDSSAGSALEASLSTPSTSSTISPPTNLSQTQPQPRTIFHHTNVTSYAANLSLFDTALSRFGRIDHAVCAAGIPERGNVFDPGLTLETVREPPDLSALETNLTAVLYFVRIASVYLRENRSGGSDGADGGDDKSLTLFSSIAGLGPSPGLFAYGAAKHGVMGLLRALRPYAPARLGMRVNAVCPWMTATQMVRGIEDAWRAAALPVNRPEDVAGCVVGIVRSRGVNGGAFYVEGGRAWEVEGLMFGDAMDLWMGRDRRVEFERGQGVLGLGDGWTGKQKAPPADDGKGKIE